MANVVLLSASPAEPSKTEALLEFVALRLNQHGHRTEFLKLRHLPAGPLLAGDANADLIASARATVTDADAVVVGSPVFKATYTGLLKVFIDLLPMDALRGKPVLPLLRSEEHTSELQSRFDLVCRLLLEKKNTQ